MSAKSPVAVLVGLFFTCTALHAAPVLPVVVLFPRTVANSDDSASLADVRKALRRDGTVEVLTFDPEGATFKRAASDVKRPDWLTSALSDTDRASLTRAVGAQFYATIGHGDKGRADIRLVDAQGSGHAWIVTGQKTGDTAHELEQHMADALSYPPPLTTPTPKIVIQSGTDGAPAAVPHQAPPDSVVLLPAPAKTVPDVVASVPPASAPIITIAPSVTAPPVTAPPTRPAQPPVATTNPPVSTSAIASAPPVTVPSVKTPTITILPTVTKAPVSPAKSPVIAAAPPVSAPSVAAVPPETTPSVAAVPPETTPSVTSPASALPNVVPPASSVTTIKVPPAAVALPNVVPPTPRPSPPTTVAMSPPVSTAPPAASPPITAAVPSPVTTKKTAVPPVVPQAPAPSLITPQSGSTVQGDTASVAQPDAVNVEDARAAAQFLSAGDDALARSDPFSAIAAYRRAVNATPLTSLPRLKLARAYQKAGMNDRALDEGRRALLIAPSDTETQNFLSELDAQNGTADGAVARATVLVTQKPDDASVHLLLGDALWNNKQTTQAEDEYRQAQMMSAPGSPARQEARAHLVRLYAAQSRYAECLTALRDAGRGGYALALSIVQGRADLLASTLDDARGTFDAGKSTHETFYKTVNDAAAQAQALSDFVEKITPPSSFALSHAHRILATQLLAQQASVLVTYVETNSGMQAQRASELEKASQTEMLTAHAAETKLGLWNAAQSANN